MLSWDLASQSSCRNASSLEGPELLPGLCCHATALSCEHTCVPAPHEAVSEGHPQINTTGELAAIGNPLACHGAALPGGELPSGPVVRCSASSCYIFLPTSFSRRWSCRRATPEIRFKEDPGSVMHRFRGGKLFCLHAEGFPRDVIQHRGCCRGAFLQNTLPFPSKYCQHGAARCARGCLDLKSFHPSLVQSQGRAAEICSEIGPRRCLCIRKRDREP